MDRNGQVVDYISLDLDKLEEMNMTVRKAYAFMGLQTKRLQNQGQGQPTKTEQARPPSLPQPPQNVPQTQQPPINRTSSQNGGSRSKSKAPPAPTATAPPYSIGVSSPHGVPVYEHTVHGLTPDKLHLPPQKRRKGNNGSAASTPANQGATPGSGTSPQLKMHPSPDHKRQNLAKSEQQPQERRFKCSDEYCHFNIKGFEKEDELQAHMTEAHQKIDNPLDFLLRSAASALDMDIDGNPKTSRPDPSAEDQRKQVAATAKSQAHLGPATIKREALKAEGQTPGKGKSGVVTPSPNVLKALSPASGRTPGSKQAQKSKPEMLAPAGNKTMLESMTEKAGITLATRPNDAKGIDTTAKPTTTTSPVVVGEDATGKDDSLSFITSMSEALTGLEGPTYNDYDMDLLFSDKSPVLTPSSSQSALTDATTNTNVSENDRLRMTFACDPWNLGSGIEFSFDQGIGLQGMGLQSSFDRTEEKNGEDQVGHSEEQPFTWDNMFHPGAGLDRNERDWDKDEFGNSVFASATFFEA